MVLGATLIFEFIYRLVTKRRLAEFIDWRLREKEVFLRHFEDHLQEIIRAIDLHFKGAEVYLLDELARGEKAAANKLHLAVVTGKKMSREEALKGEERIRRSAGLASYHPLKISFVTPEDKEKLQPKGFRFIEGS